MRKQFNIKWRDIDTARLQKAVRAFNRKLTRLAKNQPEIADYLPKKVTMSSVRERIGTRADFNREINSLDRFRRKDAVKLVQLDSGLVRTNYEIKEVRLKNQRRNRLRIQKAKDIGASYETGTMGSVRDANLQPANFDPNRMKAGDWNRFVRSVENQLRANYFSEADKLYKENYIKALHNEIPFYASQIEALVLQFSDSEFAEISMRDPDIYIDYVYAPADAERRASYIIDALQTYLGEYGHIYD